MIEKPPVRGKAEATYVIYDDNSIASACYNTFGELWLVKRRLYKGPRLMSEHVFSDRHGVEHHFEWKGGRLNRILGRAWYHRIKAAKNRSGSKGGRLTGLDFYADTETRFEYDKLGRVERIVERYLNEDGSIDKELPPQVNYQRPKKNESIPQLAKKIERMLKERIPPAVKKVRKKGPFYCLFLCYCAEDFSASWPPVVMLKTEAERQRIIERGEEVTYYLWAPDESDDTNVYLRFGGEPLDSHCELHCQLMEEKEDYSSAKKALRGVAKALNELDWSKIVDVTPDFVVAAVENTGEADFATDIKACIPATKFRTLKRRGLL